MIVLGIIDSKPSSAAILNDGQILSAIAEERLCRMKMASGMPRQAIRQVLADAGLSAKDIVLVPGTVGSIVNMLESRGPLKRSAGHWRQSPAMFHLPGRHITNSKIFFPVNGFHKFLNY